MNILERSLYELKIGSATGNLDSNASNLQAFNYSTVKVATNNFSIKNKLGEGGFGPVYKVTHQSIHIL